MAVIDYTVKGIPKEQTHEWLLKKHYAHRIPSISYAFRLYDDNDILQGVCTYGFPMASQLQEACGGIFPIIELNRLVINENLLPNTASYFVSRTIKMLPKPMGIVSYSDSGQGHHGYIYQATNFIYTGIGSGGFRWAVKGLEGLHHTSIEDSVGRYENRTKNTSLEDLLRQKYGDKLYKKEESPKHRYFHFNGNKKDRAKFIQSLKYSQLPYPKGNNRRYDARYTPQVQGVLI